MGGIKRKYGVCVHCEQDGDTTEKMLARVRPPECTYHYQREKAKIYKARADAKQSGVPKKKSSIKNMSKKLLSMNAIYRVRRDKYLAENKICEVKGCSKKSTNLHHKGGREGKLLIMVKYFMACCSSCHPNRIHFDQDSENWARENGYIVTVDSDEVRNAE